MRALLATITLGVLAAAARADEIALFQGEPRRAVVVTAETAVAITFEPEAGGAPQTLPTARVREIVHARSSDAFRVARDAEAAGRFEAAARCYRGALAIDPAYADAHFYLAVTLEKLGRSSDAKPHWVSYRRLAPNGEWVELAREFSE